LPAGWSRIPTIGPAEGTQRPCGFGSRSRPAGDQAEATLAALQNLAASRGIDGSNSAFLQRRVRRELSDADTGDIVAFLESLTGELRHRPQFFHLGPSWRNLHKDNSSEAHAGSPQMRQIIGELDELRIVE